MRNLKRALSLTLASVMLLGMMVVGAGAAGYKDVSDDHNVEAIEVLQAVGAMIGDEAGNFDPDANVNRAQIATIMSRLLDLKVEDFNAADIPFTDVPEWAVPFVAACYADGITSGISDTAYGSSNDVTAVQAALMMMKALGYFQYQDDFGQDWQLATIKQASEIGLFSGVTVDRTTPLTRNDVAQMALNALKSNLVAFTGEVGSVYEVNGASIRVGYKPEYSIKTSADPIYDRIDNLATTIDKPTGQYEMQLGEYLYGGDLRLASTTDVFGRPSRYWEFEGEEVGTYVKEELLRQAYTTSVTGKALYDLLGSATLKDYALNVTIDGVSDPEVFDGFDPQNTATNRNKYWPLFNATYLNRNNDATVGATGNGVLTQVFVDTAHKTVYIAIINTYLAYANDDYDEKNELVDLNVCGITEWKKDIFAKQSGSDEEITVTAEEFDVADVADGDFFLVTVADGAIQSMRTPDVLSEVEITSFSKGNSLTTDGTKYDYADTLDYDREALSLWTDGDNKTNLKDMTYNVYLDQYGYAIGVEEVEATKNYVFITGVNGNYNNLANVNVEANAIFLDGTMDTITINGRKSKFESAHETLKLDVDEGATVNRWFTYTVNSNGVYNVTLVDYGVKGALGQFHEDRDGVTAGNTVDYKKHNVMVYDEKDRYATTVNPQVVYSNDKTVFLTASLDELQTKAGVFSVVIDDVDSVAVGIDNVDITPWGHDEVQNNKGFKLAAPQHNNTDCIAHPTTEPGDNCNLSYGAYTLYNSKGYILGMVVVGEDNGMADNLVYVDSSSVKDESYDKATEKWTWTRNAIVNGERVLLTEVNDTGISLLENMKQHHWYRVNYNANGEVTKVRSHHYDTATGCPTDSVECRDQDSYYDDWSFGGSYAYVHLYNNPTDAIYNAIITPGVDVVLYHQQFFNEKPTNDGHTLYMVGTKDQASGIRYTEDTNVVFIQTERNKSYTEFWKGESGVKKALKALHDVDKDNQNKDYAISVLWKDGRATTIIIRDLDVQGTDGEWNVTKTGPVVFSDSKQKINSAKTLEIKNEWIRANKYGVGHVYFEMDRYPNKYDIHDTDGEFKIVYNVYVNGTDINDQVLHNKTGKMVLMEDGSGNYKFDEDLGDFFNEEDKIYVEIISWDIQSKFVVEDKGVLKGDDGIYVGWAGGMTDGDADATTPAVGASIPVEIGPKSKLTKSAITTGDIKAGETYWVEFNGNTKAVDKVTAGADGVLKFNHVMNEVDVEAKALVLTGLYDADPNSEPDEPEVPIDPSKPVAEIKVTLADIEVGKALPTPAVPTGMTAKNAVWTPADGTAKYDTEYTLTFTVTLDDAKATWAEKVSVTGLKGATTIVDNTTGVVTVTYTAPKTEEDPNAGESETVITKIEKTGDAGDYAFAITFTGPAPKLDTAEGQKLVLDALKKEFPDIDMTSMVGSTVYNGDTKVGTVTMSGLFKVYLDGKALKDKDGKEYTCTGSEDAGTKVVLPVTGEGFLVDENNPTRGFQIQTAVGSFIEFKPNGVDADVYLVAGYQLPTNSVDNSIDKVEYNSKQVDKTKDAYFPTDAVLTLTGTVKTGANNSNYTAVWLSVGGEKVGANKTVGADANTYTLDLAEAAKNAKMIKDGVIGVIKEEGATITTIKIGSFQHEFDEALTAPVEITILPSMVTEAAKVVSGDYMVKEANMADYADSNATVIAVVNDGSKITIGAQGDSLTADENVLELIPVTKVTFKFEATSAAAKFSVGYDSKDLQTGTGEDWYFKTGVEFKPEYTVDGKTAQISAIIVDDQSTKVKDVAIGANGLIKVPAMAKGEAGIVVTFLEEVTEVQPVATKIDANSLAVTGIFGDTAGVELANTDGDPEYDDTTKILSFTLAAKNGYCFAENVTVKDATNNTGKNGFEDGAAVLNEDGTLTITCTVTTAG